MSIGLKIFSVITTITLTVLLWYAVYIYFFVGPIVWLGNVIMFYMNFTFIVYFIGPFADEKAKIKMKKDKFFHWYIDVFEMFILAFLFAAFGWWYYAIISGLMFMFIITIFKED